jgi:hypothetical protein
VYKDLINGLVMLTGLSDGDRHVVLGRLTSILEQELNVAVLSLSSADMNNSAQTIIDVLVDKYCYQCIYKTALTRKRTSSSTSITAMIQQHMTLSEQYLRQLNLSANASFGFVPTNYGKSSHQQLDSVTKLEHLHFTSCLQSLFKLQASTTDTTSSLGSVNGDSSSVASSIFSLAHNSVGPLVLLVEHAECVLTDIFNDLLLLLSTKTSILKILLVIVHSQTCSLMTFHNPHSRALLCGSTVLRALTPFQLYDSVMSNIFAAREIPVSVSAELIGWLHESYWRSHMCIQTVIDRVLMCLGFHFRRRTSLFSMYEDSTWLYEVRHDSFARVTC